MESDLHRKERERIDRIVESAFDEVMERDAIQCQRIGKPIPPDNPNLECSIACTINGYIQILPIRKRHTIDEEDRVIIEELKAEIRRIATR